MTMTDPNTPTSQEEIDISIQTVVRDNILFEWTDVTVVRVSAMWNVVGYFQGRKISGSGQNALDVARNMADSITKTPPKRVPGGVVYASKDAELAAAADLATAKAILRQRVAAEAARRSGISVQALLRISELALIISDPMTPPVTRRDAELEAEQFADRAAAARPYEEARSRKDTDIAGLQSITDAYAYDIAAGWPT